MLNADGLTGVGAKDANTSEKNVFCIFNIFVFCIFNLVVVVKVSPTSIKALRKFSSMREVYVQKKTTPIRSCFMKVA